MIKIYDYNDVGQVFVCGDIHGNFKSLMHHIKTNTHSLNDYELFQHPLEKEEQEAEEARREEARRVIENGPRVAIEMPVIGHIFNRPRMSNLDHTCPHDTYKNSLIFVCGDCGLGFNREQYYIDLFGKYNEMLSQINATILFVRGNHDDPMYFTNEKINFSHIKTVPDYSIVKTMYFTTLCIGGAISIDRIWRKQQEVRINKYTHSHKKKLYWENEGIVVDEALLNEIIHLGDVKVDSIISHSAPAFVFPTTKPTCKEWLKLDKNLRADMQTERNNLSFIYDFLTNHGVELTFWAYGHFHHNNLNKHKNCLFMAKGLNNDMSNVNELVERFNSKFSIPQFKASSMTTSEALDRLITTLHDQRPHLVGGPFDDIVEGIPGPMENMEIHVDAPLEEHNDIVLGDGIAAF